MSGPMTAGFEMGSSLVFAAASIAAGAAEIAAGMKEAERAAEETRRQRRAERRRMQAAERAGIETRRQDGERRAARLRSLLAAREKLEGRPAADLPTPADAADAAAHAAWLAALDALGAETEARLREAAAARGGEVAAVLDALLAAGVSTREQLAAFLAQARLAGASVDVAEARRELVARVLERLERTPDEPLPPALDALALQLVAAPTQERAEALATELRYRVQRHNADRTAAAEEARLREAAAVVLEQSLRDLGYEVEEIAETLFVEGGVAHFQRPEWGDYFVRLRIDPARKTMNFNVVRAGTAGEDRKHEDMLAEERWCAAHPKLFDTLKARGLAINVTRMLQAGEAPVQVVDAATLPVRAVEERRDETPKVRSIE
jgi:hypothetical protein